MPVYSYKAFKQDGAPETGVVDADSPKDARLKLKGRKLHVTDLEALEAAKGGAGRSKLGRNFFRRRKPEQLAIVTRQMATLLASGIPMIGALSAVIEQQDHEGLKTALMQIRERVSQGVSLSDALAEQSFYFEEMYVNMVQAGEAGGNLDRILYNLADYLHSQNRTRAKVMAALMYPIIMLVIGVGVVLVLLTYVVPKILDVIRKQEAALPLPTEILLVVSGFMGDYWWLLAAMVFLAWMAYRQTRRTVAGRLWLDTVKLRIPVIGPLMRKAAVSRFAVTLSTLLGSGLPVLESLQVVQRVVGNALLANTLEQVRQKVGEGADISTPLKASKVFPPVVAYMISVGEESGRLEELLKKIADAYDEEVEVAAQKMTAVLEPLMIVFMAGIVGFIVMAVMLPILQMSNL